jgi:hypothetical protein
MTEATPTPARPGATSRISGTTTIYAHVSTTKQRADVARYLEGLGK